MFGKFLRHTCRDFQPGIRIRYRSSLMRLIKLEDFCGRTKPANHGSNGAFAVRRNGLAHHCDIELVPLARSRRFLRTRRRDHSMTGTLENHPASLE